MEPIGKLLNQQGLVRRSPDGITTAPNGNAPSEPQWVEKLELMAISKRQDWAPGILSYWTEKLDKYTDAEICWALKVYSGEFFPDPDAIAGDIDRKRFRDGQARDDERWAAWKAANAEAKTNGLMASKEEISEYARRIEECWRSELALSQSKVLGGK